MSSPLVIAALAALAVAGVGIGVWLARPRPSGSSSSSGTLSHSQSPTAQQPAPAADVPRAELNLEELAKRLHMPLSALQQHVCSYHTVEIPKPRGGKRRLEIPDQETRQLQRRILHSLLQSLNAHPFACGFEQDTSIVDAALPHQRKAIVVKMDVRRFFESTSATRIQNYFAGIGWDAQAAALLTELTTCNGHLPQGAPTSPRLSNLVNARLDESLLRIARRHGGGYSRYADDITMSFPKGRGRKVRGLTQAVRRILKMYGYTMHGGRKLKFYRQHQRQAVLGLVVNQKVALPRKTRRWLRAVRHHADHGRPTTLSEAQLQGWESLQRMIETQREG